MHSKLPTTPRSHPTTHIVNKNDDNNLDTASINIITTTTIITITTIITSIIIITSATKPRSVYLSSTGGGLTSDDTSSHAKTCEARPTTRQPLHSVAHDGRGCGGKGALRKRARVQGGGNRIIRSASISEAALI